MKRIWEIIGRVIFWLTWPALRLRLRFTTRTRVLIRCGNEILVVKNWLGSGKWGLPGGGVKTNEDPLTTALREVKEELNVVLKPSSCKKVGIFEYKSSGLSFVYSLYKVNLTKKPDVKRQKMEITKTLWINKDKLNKDNSASDVLQALQTIQR